MALVVLSLKVKPRQALLHCLAKGMQMDLEISHIYTNSSITGFHAACPLMCTVDVRIFQCEVHVVCFVSRSKSENTKLLVNTKEEEEMREFQSVSLIQYFKMKNKMKKKRNLNKIFDVLKKNWIVSRQTHAEPRSDIYLILDQTLHTYTKYK